MYLSHVCKRKSVQTLIKLSYTQTKQIHVKVFLAISAYCSSDRFHVVTEFPQVFLLSTLISAAVSSFPSLVFIPKSADGTS